MQLSLSRYKRQRLEERESDDSRDVSASEGVCVPLSLLAPTRLGELQTSLNVRPRATFDKTQVADPI